MTEINRIKLCENCVNEINGNYCSNCGHPKELRRINGKYILSEISSVFNLEKGFFYTVKELIVNPGYSIKRFIEKDRNRLVKPVFFVVLSSIIFTIFSQYLKFNTGGYEEGKYTPGIELVYKWIGKNFGFVNIILGIFAAFFIKLFFFKSKYNIYEILILTFFAIGVGNLFYTLLGIIESATGFYNNGLAFIIGVLYSTWVIGNFFSKKNLWAYIKGGFAYLVGIIFGSLFFQLIGIIIDLINKSS